jgi:transposase
MDDEGFRCPRCDVVVPFSSLVRGICPHCGEIIDLDE